MTQTINYDSRFQAYHDSDEDLNNIDNGNQTINKIKRAGNHQTNNGKFSIDQVGTSSGSFEQSTSYSPSSANMGRVPVCLRHPTMSGYANQPPSQDFVEDLTPFSVRAYESMEALGRSFLDSGEDVFAQEHAAPEDSDLDSLKDDEDFVDDTDMIDTRFDETRPRHGCNGSQNEGILCNMASQPENVKEDASVQSEHELEQDKDMKEFNAARWFTVPNPTPPESTRVRFIAQLTILMSIAFMDFTIEGKFLLVATWIYISYKPHVDIFDIQLVLTISVLRLLTTWFREFVKAI